MKAHDITPVPKPRMTRRDKWLKPPRPCVARYWAFCDEVFHAKIDLLEAGTSIMFVLPMPKSWSKQKKQEMYMKPHQQKPDVSNLLKALEDAVYQDDCVIWDYSGLRKVWVDKGQIWIQNKTVKG